MRRAVLIGMRFFARVSRPLFLSLAASLALLAGCDCGGSLGSRLPDGAVEPIDGSPLLSGLTSLRVEPADATVEVRGGVAGTQAFTAIGTFDDGSERDVSTLVTWSVRSAVALGGFRVNEFVSTTLHGGRGEVRATANGRFATASITVRLAESAAIAPTSGAPALPADPGSIFEGASADASRAPTLVYPNDGVVLPPNLGRVEIHWLRGPATNTLFEIAFENDVTDVRAWARCERPEGVRDDGCIWEPTGAVWTWIAETNRGGEPLRVRVRATDDAGSAVGESGELELRFARDRLEGTIYYWTTSDGGRIMRYDFGAADGMAERVMGPEQTTSGRCVGCHAVSLDGRRIVASVGGQNRGGMLLYDLETYTPLFNASGNDDHVIQFASFNPDGTRLAGVYGDDDRGTMGMFLFDTECTAATMATCGQQIGVIATGGREPSHPAWSPDGARIAYTDVGDAGSTSQRPTRAAISYVEREGDGWSEPRELVARVDGLSRYNPAWAPVAGAFLVFNESTCPGGDGGHRDCNADSDPTASIYAVGRDGGASVLLAAAHAPGVMDEGRTELNDTFPRFSPFEFVLGSGDLGDTRLLWLSFSSTRAYGLREPPGGNDESGGRGTYLWMTAVLPERVDAGTDPSMPAFALPFQDLATSNHIAVWTTESVGVIGPM